MVQFKEVEKVVFLDIDISTDHDVEELEEQTPVPPDQGKGHPFIEDLK